jgi:ubiquitin
MTAYRIPKMDADEARQKIHNLLLTGDNRLKQGVSAEKIRQNYEQALELAREHGLAESVGPLIEIRLGDLERLAGGSPPPAPPDA